MDIGVCDQDDEVLAAKRDTLSGSVPALGGAIRASVIGRRKVATPPHTFTTLGPPAVQE